MDCDRFIDFPLRNTCKGQRAGRADLSENLSEVKKKRAEAGKD